MHGCNIRDDGKDINDAIIEAVLSPRRLLRKVTKVMILTGAFVEAVRSIYSTITKVFSEKKTRGTLRHSSDLKPSSKLSVDCG